MTAARSTSSSARTASSRSTAAHGGTAWQPQYAYRTSSLSRQSSAFAGPRRSSRANPQSVRHSDQGRNVAIVRGSDVLAKRSGTLDELRALPAVQLQTLRPLHTCHVRRAAFAAWGVPDSTQYVY